MMTGSFDPHPRTSDWLWSHGIVSDDDGLPFNLDGCLFTVGIWFPHWEHRCPDYGWYGMPTYQPSPSLTLDNAAYGGVTVPEEGTILVAVPRLVLWHGHNRVTLDASRYGETLRLLDMTLPIIGP